MLLKVFTVYDSKAQCFLQPFFCRSTGDAVRSFAEIANDPKSQIGKYPVDFNLFELGTFDDVACQFDLLTAPVSMGLANDYVTVSSVRSLNEEQLSMVN